MSTIKNTNSLKNFVGCGHLCSQYDSKTKEHIKLIGHKGYWHVISERYGCSQNFKHFREPHQMYYMCEHDTYGDEAAFVIIDSEYNIILEDVWNGWPDLDEYWEALDEEYLQEICENKLQDVTSSNMTSDSYLVSGKWKNKFFSVIVLLWDKTHRFFYNGEKPEENTEEFENILCKYLGI